MFQAEEDRESRQALILSGSLFETHNGNIIGSQDGAPLLNPGGPINGRWQSTGFYTRGEAGLFYGRRNSRLKFSSSGRVGLNYYADLGNLTQSSYRGTADFLLLLRRTKIWAGESVIRSPYFVFSAFPVLPNSDGAPPVAVAESENLAVSAQPMTISSTAARLSQALTRHSSLELSYGFRFADSAAALADLSSNSGAARLSLEVGRRTVVHAAYTDESAEYRRPAATGNKIHNQSLDVGLEYTRLLSPRRKIGVAVGSGASLMGKEGDALPEKTYYQILGSSTLSYDVGQTWSARVEYRRMLQLLEGLPEPFFANGLIVRLGRPIGRRVEILGDARYSQGEVGVQAVAKGYDARTGSVRLRYALTRQFALSTEYIYYDYKFSRVAELPDGVPRALTRHVARIGLSFGAALLHTQSRP